MAIEVIAKVMEYDLPPREKYVLMLYSNYANPEGEGVWPSQSSISMVSGYSRQTINKVTDILERGGLLLPDGVTKYGTKNWKINTVWPGSRADIEAIIGDVNTGLHPDVKASLQGPVNPALHNTSKEPSKKHASRDVLTDAVMGKPDQLEGYPEDVKDVLSAFVEVFRRDPAASEKAFWIKTARKWKEIGVKPGDVKRMYAHSREQGLAIKSPESITFAYDELRREPKKEYRRAD